MTLQLTSLYHLYLIQKRWRLLSRKFPGLYRRFSELQRWFFESWDLTSERMFDSLQWLCFLSLAGPQSDLWRWQDTKCKVPILILLFPPFSQSLTWRSSRPSLVFSLFKALVCIVTLLLISISLDVAQIVSFILVLLCYLSSIDLSDWMASSMTSMLVFLESLDLKLISGRRIVWLILVFWSFILVLLIDVVFVFLTDGL